MQKSIIATTAVVFMIGAFAPYASAQQSSGQPSKLDVVEVVGCLSEEPKGTWRVTNATDPIVSKTPYTNEAAIKAADAKPLGSRQYGLIAISMFNPDAHRGHESLARRSSRGRIGVGRFDEDLYCGRSMSRSIARRFSRGCTYTAGTLGVTKA